MSQGGHIAVERRGPIAHVRIVNPLKFNAMSLSMWEDLASHIRTLDIDPEVRVLVIRGDGHKAFVSGADISEFDSKRSPESGSEFYDRAVEQAQAALIESRLPAIALIHGVCMGGGLGLAMACDLRYAADTARFRMPAARLGLGYSFGGIRRMVSMIGAPAVADLFFTARTFDGAEAHRMGLVNASYEPDQLEARVEHAASMIAENAPLTVRLAKRSIQLALTPSSQEAAIELERERQRCVRSADYVEGRRAFAEKRVPRFSGA